MNQPVQPAKLSPLTLLTYAIIFLLIALLGISCSKKEQVGIPGKDLSLMKELSFDIFPGNIYDEEVSKEIAVRLKITVSGMVTGAIQKQILWDTLITSNSVYDYLAVSKGSPIKTTISADAETLRHLVIDYLVVYSHQGKINTRSGAYNHTDERAFRIGL